MEKTGQPIVLAKAVERFAADRRLKEAFGEEISIEELAELAKAVPTDFFGTIMERSPVVGLHLATQSEMWKSRVIDNKDYQTVDSQFDVSSGVNYQHVKGKLIPSLYITTKDIRSLMTTGIEALFSRYEEAEVKDKTVKSAEVMRGWYEMGLWMMDMLDLDQEAFDRIHNTSEEVAIWRSMAQIAKVDPETMIDQDTREQAWAVTRYRVAGGLAYAGLARYVHSFELEGSRLSIAEVTLLQKFKAVSFQQKFLQNGVYDVSGLDFALGSPITRLEMDALLSAYTDLLAITT